jgi:hypothetical protein
MVEKSKIKDLFEFNLSDETYVSAWTDGDFTFLTIDFVTLAISNDVFDELLQKLVVYMKGRNKG